jgi:hypothetical protein
MQNPTGHGGFDAPALPENVKTTRLATAVKASFILAAPFAAGATPRSSF